MPCASIAAMCSALSRRASKPPWIVGCSVLTRPSSISGNPVCSATSVTFSPAPASSFAVPPVESSLTPRPASSRASSTTPVLSETDISACMGVSSSPRRGARSLDQLVLDELAAQRVAVDAEPFGGPALVAAGLLHHDLEQWPFDDAQDHLVHRRRLDAAQVPEVALQALADALLDVLLVGVWHEGQWSGKATSPDDSSARGMHGIASASRSNQAATARAWASHDSIAFISERNASPPGRPLSVQPMCFLALRTPANSP